MAALVREGPLRTTVEQTSAMSGISARTLWRWIARYRAQPSTAALLLEKVGVAPKARRLSAEAEHEINASIDTVFLTQPRGSNLPLASGPVAPIRLRETSVPHGPAHRPRRSSQGRTGTWCISWTTC